MSKLPHKNLQYSHADSVYKAQVVILSLGENVAEAAVEVEVIPTSAEVKENVALAICCAARNGNLLFLS